ncbi:MAG: hypothetical protein U1F43_36320 [Myxococcota bacterium]
MYTAALPKSKMMTPAPRAVFDGSLTVDGEVLDVRGWVGLRGHNWGREHAHLTPTATARCGTTTAACPACTSTASRPRSASGR